MGRAELLLAAVALLLPLCLPAQQTNATTFIRQCLRVKEIHFRSGELPAPSVGVMSKWTNSPRKCLDYRCFSRDERRDLRHLNKLACSSHSDCLGDLSAMRCHSGFCDCQRGFAYNPLSCQCQEAEQCGDSPAELCHNGMKCSDRLCGCDSFKQKLIEPHSQLCIEAKTTDTVNTFYVHSEGAGPSGFVIALIIVACLISVVIVLLGISMGSQPVREWCDSGQYVCDEGGQEGSEKVRTTQPLHVAAWDLPGLDYLSEEQTMKYLKRGRTSPVDDDDNGGQQPTLRRSDGQDGINLSPSPSSSGGVSGGSSLPESDRFECRKLTQRASLQSLSSTVHSNVL